MQRKLSGLFILITFVIPSALHAQDTLQVWDSDTTWHKQWIQHWPAMRMGLGDQRHFFTEIGYSNIKTTHQDSLRKLVAVSCKYVSIEWTNPDKFAGKIGIETCGRALGTLMAVGLEGKYQTDFHKVDYVIQPRIGIGVICVFSMYLGYNISLNDRPFDNIARFQFSVVFNMFSKILKKI